LGEKSDFSKKSDLFETWMRNPIFPKNRIYLKLGEKSDFSKKSDFFDPIEPLGGEI
jgi:hypothetical protein